jgi:hypothetical protein
MSVEVRASGKESDSECVDGSSLRESHIWLMAGRLMEMETAMMARERRMVAQVKYVLVLWIVKA